MENKAVRNIEIKARIVDLSVIRNRLIDRKAKFVGLDHQIDTYFQVKSGRLKLRQGNIENHLIYYERPDQDVPKLSEVLLYPVERNSSIRQLLTKALGVDVIVNKKREIYFIDHIKFHLDVVRDLGTYVEIEVIDDGAGIEPEVMIKTCEEFMQVLVIESEQLVSSSYADLLRNA